MKKVFAIVLSTVMVLGIFSCRKPGEKPLGQKLEAELLKDTTSIAFANDDTTFAFGTIMQDDKVHHTFKLVNTGDKNLIIAHAFGSCGCTVPEYPKDPVKPCDTANIAVTFNSAGKKGEQHKNVTIVCNTLKRNEMVYLTGFVKTEEDK